MQEENSHNQHKAHRPISAKHMLQYLTYHQQRSNWLRKNRKYKDADKHEADLKIGLDHSSANERTTFEFISGNLGTPNFPRVDGYEPYPLPLSTRGMHATKWFKPGERRIAFFIPLPEWAATQIKDKTKDLNNWDRAELMRDILAKHFGIEPAETA